MKTSIFSFGWGHAHAVAGITFDRDSLVSITAENPRKVMFETFGRQWSMEYEPKEAERYLHRFPRGIIELPGYEVRRMETKP